MANPMYWDEDLTPYFQIESDSPQGPIRSGTRPTMQSQLPETTRYETPYEEMMGHDSRVYRWFRPEVRSELEEGEIPPIFSESVTKVRKWIDKYTGKKPGESSRSTSSTPFFGMEIEEMANVDVATTPTRRTEGVEELNLPQTEPAERPTDRERETSRKDVKKLERLIRENLQEVEKPNEITDGSRKSLIQATLARFQELWEKYEYDTNEKRVGRQSWMKAAAHMREEKSSLDEDIIGEVEGVEVGDGFTSRGEMSVIGLHKELIAGINILKRPEEAGGPIATSIVFGVGSSYSDNDYRESTEGQPSIYSGQGGLPSSRGSSTKKYSVGIYKDQKLTPGNAALIKSFDEKIPVRVIKGAENVKSDEKKYVYDGLFDIAEYKFEKGVHGNKVYKFVLNRRDR